MHFGLPGVDFILAGSCRSELPALGQAPEQVLAGLSFHPQPAGAAQVTGSLREEGLWESPLGICHPALCKARGP